MGHRPLRFGFGGDKDYVVADFFDAVPFYNNILLGREKAEKTAFARNNNGVDPARGKVYVDIGHEA